MGVCWLRTFRKIRETFWSPAMKKLTVEEFNLFKRLVREGVHPRELALGMAYWVWTPARVSFTDYMANWLAAGNADAPALLKYFPLTGARRIANWRTAWGSYEQDPPSAS
jgi:hypothetical protein